MFLKEGEVYTFKQAKELYLLSDEAVLRNAVKHKRFRPDEIEKVGNTWLVTKDAMDRLYKDFKLKKEKKLKEKNNNN